MVNNTLGDNQIYVLKLLLHSRCLTHKQILKCFYGHLGQEFLTTQNGNIYNLLNRLIKRGLVTRERAGKQMKNKACEDYFYFLTDVGLEYIEKLLGLQLHRQASGFDDEYNSMPYDLYKTTIASARNAQVEHTFFNKEVYASLMLLNNRAQLNQELGNIRSDSNLKFQYHEISKDVQALNKLTPIADRILKDRRATNYVTYRNNLYCAPVKGEVAYKPDGEVEIHGQRYALEIDMGTERGETLNEKFERFNERIAELKMKNTPILRGMIFVLKTKGEYSTLTNPNHHIMNRFRNIHEAYRKANLAHLDSTALHVVLLNDFELMVPALTSRAQQQVRNDFEKTLNNITGTIIDWKDADTTAQYKLSNYHSQYYLYAHIEGSNSKAWHEISETRKKFEDMIESKTGNRQKLKVIVVFKNIVPIFPYHPNQLKGIEQEFFDTSYLVQLRANTLTWYTADYLPCENPFS